MKQPSFYQFKAVLTDDQLELLCECDDRDGFASAGLIITNEGVFYMDGGGYNPTMIQKHFDMLLEHVMELGE